MTRILIIVFLIVFLSPVSEAQVASVAVNSRTMEELCESGKPSHKDLLLVRKPDYGFINGKDYYPYYFRSKRQPVLFADEKCNVTVNLNGKIYDDIAVQYDTFTDEVVFSDTENKFGLGQYMVALNKDNINSFIFYYEDDTLIFINYNISTHPDFNLPGGFYETAYTGEIEYIIRHRSVVRKKDGIDEYFYSPLQYVKSKGGFIKFRTNKQFIAIFDGRQNEMKKIVAKSGINVRHADKSRIIRLLKLYDAVCTGEK